MHACMLAAKGGIWFSTFSSFFMNKEKGEREREKKKGKGYKESNEIFPLLRHLWMG